MTEFITWDILGTYTGALAMVMTLTQFTKDLPFTKNIPTQLWSYILAVVVMICAQMFTGELSLNVFVLTLFNAVIVSIASNGGFSAIQKVTGKSTNQ